MKLEILDADEEVARTYSRLFRTLKSAGRLIDANDLWIASTANSNLKRRRKTENP